jgi:hypothetical protein
MTNTEFRMGKVGRLYRSGVYFVVAGQGSTPTVKNIAAMK